MPFGYVNLCLDKTSLGERIETIQGHKDRGNKVTLPHEQRHPVPVSSSTWMISPGRTLGVGQSQSPAQSGKAIILPRRAADRRSTSSVMTTI